MRRRSTYTFASSAAAWCQLSDSGAIEGWSDEDLKATAATYFGDGADADLPDHIRLVYNIGRLILRRANQVPTPESKPSAFFLLPQAPASAESTALDDQPMLGTGRHELAGRFWFVGPAARQGTALVLDAWPEKDADVFDLACEKLGIGGAPAVIFEARTSPQLLWFYPCGLANREMANPVPLSSEGIGLKQILSIIDRAHHDSIVTPRPRGSQGMKLWKNASKHHPVKDVEARIQEILRIALTAALPPTMVVRDEQHQTTGRIDLEIEESNAMPGHFVRHALLELKVLRSYGSTGRTVSVANVTNAIKEGVSQAKSYRDERETQSAALCCFDMRKEPGGTDCFDPVKQQARRNKVELRVWPVYASAKQYRTT
jgi:hypothetical protein